MDELNWFKTASGLSEHYHFNAQLDSDNHILTLEIFESEYLSFPVEWHELVDVWSVWILALNKAR